MDGFFEREVELGPPGRNRQTDLFVIAGLHQELGVIAVEGKDVGGIRYQLLHRAASAIYEAKRYRCRDAMMRVHSFSPTHRWFEDFAEFSSLMAQPVRAPGSVSTAKWCDGISLSPAWVADTARETQYSR